ncbi:MAG: carbohydrate porin [Azospirillum brasilense]|nr:MAG: carbohydrate porin [Azospirillum brasilense]
MLSSRSALRLAPSAALVLALLHAAPAARAQQGGSPAIPNAGPPGEALLPELAALQDRLEREGWLVRGQSTFVLQGHSSFRSPYRDDASLSPKANARNTSSTDIIVGRRLWAGAEAFVDVSVTRGFGLSNSVGVAAFPSNEAFRLGTEEPYIYTPRIFLRQVVGLSAETVDSDGDDQLRFGGPVPRERLTLTVGKFGVWDVFDDNRYAHDPRTGFLNWALVGGAAFDYAADARGWTEGMAAEYDDGTWGVRTGAFRVARRANGLFLDTALTRGWQLLAEVDRFWSVGDLPGAVRLIYGASRARQSTWGEIFENGFGTFPQNPAGYRLKHNVTLNAEQEIAPDLGAFVRMSWNDGRTQNFMFTQVDRAVSGGLVLRGGGWDRPGDTVGVAANASWISAGQRQYLKAGGIGFIVGDGRLDYRPEVVAEAYYDARVAPGVHAALNYQFVANPGYNRDRGPVHVLGLRLRTAF